MVIMKLIFVEIPLFCKEMVVVLASIAIFWFPRFVLWEGDDSIAFIMNDDLPNSYIRPVAMILDLL
jgi:hypothetical protein